MATYTSEPRQPSVTSSVATATGETAKGFGLGVLGSIAAVAAPFVILPLLFSSAATIGTGAAIALGIFTVGASVVGFFAGPFAGTLFGAKRGIDKIERNAATSEDYQRARSVLAAQEVELGRAETNYAAPQRSGFMNQAPVYAVAGGECPTCKVNSMNYQGQAIAGLQQAL